MSFRTIAFATLRRGWIVVALTVLSGLSTQCDYEAYPVAATFCDDWCQVLLRKDCDQEPENCVRICERSLPNEPCLSLQRELLDCYRAAPLDGFVCSGSGFGAATRPKESTCQAPRDALIECAYPDVRVCLDVCRAVESSLTDGGTDAAAASATDRKCPSDDIPCDSICWIAGRYLSSPSDAGSDAAADSSFAGANSFDESATQLIACALDKANRCRQGQPTSPDAGESDETWGTVLASCADEQSGGM
ncbi:MAG TPA: hypothetical protein PKA88_04390 [Polyangiaceae bacterium]|nr:hypothetical protein [Polyangiaceae bacterium]